MDIQFVISSATAFLEILFFGGVVFGFPSLQYVLEQEGYFENLCSSNVTQKHLNATNLTNSAHITCADQEANFNLAFTLGSSLLFLVAFPWGYLLDRFGTWIFRSILSVSYSLGYILLTVSSPNSATLLFPVLILFGISGLGILMSNYQIANLAKTVRGSMITFMNGLFSSSVVVFLIIKKGYDSEIDLYLMLQIMTCLTVFLWLRTYLLLPQKTIPFPVPHEGLKYGWKEIYCCSKGKEEIDGTSAFLDKEIEDNEKISSESKSFKDTLTDLLYWTDMYHYCVIAIRLSFLFSSLLTWIRSFEDPDQISKLTDDFGVIVLFGVCISPFNGFIIDSIRKFLKSSNSDEKVINLKASFVSMLITSILSIIYSGLAVVPSTYGTFVFHLLTRAFSHGGHTAFVASNFPFYHFGKLYGLAGSVLGVLSFLQYGLFQISIHFDPDFYYINLGFLIACILTLVHPLAIYIRIKRICSFKESEYQRSKNASLEKSD